MTDLFSVTMTNIVNLKGLHRSAVPFSFGKLLIPRQIVLIIVVRFVVVVELFPVLIV